MLKKDVGGAGQFFVGLRLAYEKGFDWIWLMDDDVVPDLNALR
jgi:rhamnopyranosyl-N-acetylglucosaminyl-diphospho-decaprenol beta-1,3/1,4-galactofuranosyltransferase